MNAKIPQDKLGIGRRSDMTEWTRGMTMAQKVELAVKKIEEGCARLTSSEEWKRYLEVQAKFHRYSFNNAMLILLQCPYAIQVAGYKTWQKLGRQVKVGEKGIRIFAPRTYKEEIVMEDGTVEVRENRYYVVVCVYDISQTDGKELPTVCQRLEGATLGELWDKLCQVAEKAGLKVEVCSTHGLNGYYDRDTSTIAVEAANDLDQRTKTLVHELAHAKLHGDSEEPVSREQGEFEAESVAYVVLQALGYDSGQYSFGYVAGWIGAENVTQQIKVSATRIHAAAKYILDSLEEGEVTNAA